MVHRYLAMSQEGDRQVGTERGSYDKFEMADALLFQEALDLFHLICLAQVVLACAVGGCCWHDAEIIICKIACDRLAASAGDAHSMEEEDGGMVRISQSLEEHGCLPLFND